MLVKKLREKQLFLGVLTLALAMFLPEFAQGQPPLPGVDDGMIVVPISGGIAVLLAVGAAYGIKKSRK